MRRAAAREETAARPEAGAKNPHVPAASGAPCRTPQPPILASFPPRAAHTSRVQPLICRVDLHRLTRLHAAELSRPRGEGALPDPGTAAAVGRPGRGDPADSGPGARPHRSVGAAENDQHVFGRARRADGGRAMCFAEYSRVLHLRWH